MDASGLPKSARKRRGVSRELGDLEKKIPKYAYFPFGGGPRMCIEHVFATMEAVLMLASFARVLRAPLVASHKLVVAPAITLRPKTGVRVRLERRRSGVN